MTPSILKFLTKLFQFAILWCLTLHLSPYTFASECNDRSGISFQKYNVAGELNSCSSSMAPSMKTEHKVCAQSDHVPISSPKNNELRNLKKDSGGRKVVYKARDNIRENPKAVVDAGKYLTPEVASDGITGSFATCALNPIKFSVVAYKKRCISLNPSESMFWTNWTKNVCIKWNGMQLEIFDDLILWNDWMADKIMTANKFTVQTEITDITNLGAWGPKVVKNGACDNGAQVTIRSEPVHGISNERLLTRDPTPDKPPGPTQKDQNDDKNKKKASDTNDFFVKVFGLIFLFWFLKTYWQ